MFTFPDHPIIPKKEAQFICGPTPNCLRCNDTKVIMTRPAGAGHEDDLAEYTPCPCTQENFE